MRACAFRSMRRGYLHVFDGLDQVLASLNVIKHLDAERFGLVGGAGF